MARLWPPVIYSLSPRRRLRRLRQMQHPFHILVAGTIFRILSSGWLS